MDFTAGILFRPFRPLEVYSFEYTSSGRILGSRLERLDVWLITYTRIALRALRCVVDNVYSDSAGFQQDSLDDDDCFVYLPKN